MRFLYSFLAVCFAVRLFAVPAYTGLVKVIVPDGHVYISLKGDENCKYGITDSGYTVLQNAGFWYYACVNGKGDVFCSEYLLMQSPDNTTKEFLSMTPKGLIPSASKEIQDTNRVISHSRNMGYGSVVGERKALVILMQFSDLSFKYSSRDFDELFNMANYTKDGAEGSVYDFYKFASYGQLELKSDVLGPYTSRNKVSYYGGNSGVGGQDKNPFALFQEAIEHAKKEVNFADYDCNADGYVDNVHIIFAGYGEEAGAMSSAIWSHQMSFSPISVQGVMIDRYSCSPELRGNAGTGITRIGVPCHEIGHALGATDYYDTNYQAGGQFYGTGEWDVMAEGSWNNGGISPADFNPYVKVYNYGWAHLKDLRLGEENVIKPSHNVDEIYRISTNVSGDFFLFENRRNYKFNSHIPGEGLLIYHVGPDIDQKALYNTINTGFPQQCYPVCASSSYSVPTSSSSSYGNINSAGCPYPGVSGNTEFSSSSKPASYCFNGKPSGIEVTGIKESGENILLTLVSNTDDTEAADNVWYDGFEKNTLGSFWIPKDVHGEATWNIRKVLSASPLNVVDGVGYLSMSSNNASPLITSRIVSRLQSDRIRIEPGAKYNFSFFCRKESEVNNDSVRVLFSSDCSVWNEGMDAEVTNSGDWTVYTKEVMTDTGDLWIILEANIKKGTKMYFDAVSIGKIDNGSLSVCMSEVLGSMLKVLTKNGITTIINMSESKQDVQVCNSNGVILFKMELPPGCAHEVSLGNGLYIVKSGFYVQKFLVKGL